MSRTLLYQHRCDICGNTETIDPYRQRSSTHCGNGYHLPDGWIAMKYHEDRDYNGETWTGPFTNEACSRECAAALLARVYRNRATLAAALASKTTP